MSLAALGCDPTQTWERSDGTDGPGASPGDLRYSGSAIYLCVEADAALRQYSACFLKGVFKAREGTDALAHGGVPVCVPQTAIANGHYGWGLVFGKGRVLSDGGVQNGRGYSFANRCRRAGRASGFNGPDHRHVCDRGGRCDRRADDMHLPGGVRLMAPWQWGERRWSRRGVSRGPGRLSHERLGGRLLRPMGGPRRSGCSPRYRRPDPRRRDAEGIGGDTAMSEAPITRGDPNSPPMMGQDDSRVL